LSRRAAGKEKIVKIEGVNPGAEQAHGGDRREIMTRKKVVFIGAGSVVFTSGLIADLVADGGEWDLRLVDTDEERLEAISGLAERLVQATSAPISLSRSTQRKDLLPGADFVVTMLDVGGRRAWEEDINIPRKYGIYMPVADTTTPGGFARSLRILPTMVEIGRDIATLCPDAKFFNYCNPMAATVRAINREAGKEVFGLCHGVQGAKKYLAKFLGVEPERCECKAVGFNHFVWMMEFRVDGKDAYPLIREKNEALKAQGKLPGDDEDHQTSWRLFEVFGCFPSSRDRHITEFFPQFHGGGRHYGKTLGVDRFPLEKFISGGDADYERMRRVARGEEPLPQSLLDRQPGQHERLVCILRAMEKQSPEVYHATVPNTGQVENLERGLCIECPVEFCRSGARPVPMGSLPLGIKANIDKAFLTTELIIDAALERDRAKFIQAIIIDGWVSSIEQANQLADELIQAHKRYLPGW
jgi:alpha-galactosidase